MIDNQFQLEMQIGIGGSSKVFRATNIQTDEKVAVKVIRFDKFQSIKNGELMLETEYSRMKIFEGHPNILKSYCCNANGVLEVNGDCMGVMYNVIELAENGSMASIIRLTGGLGEELAKFYFKQILHAVNHIHFYGIAHMDIKVENILLDEYFNAKIADFGVSADVSQTGGVDNRVRGTVCYMAPEIFNLTPTESYDAYKADIYSLGVCLYVMLFGEFPEKENLETCSNLELDTIGSINGMNCSANNKKACNFVSSGFQALLNRMLSINPEERPSISEILECDWMQSDCCEQFIQDVFEEMEQRKEFCESMKLQQNKVHQL